MTSDDLLFKCICLLNKNCSLLIYLFVHVSVCVCVLMLQQAYGTQRITHGVSLFLWCEFQWLNLSSQSLGQVPLPTEHSCWHSTCITFEEIYLSSLTVSSKMFNGLWSLQNIINSHVLLFVFEIFSFPICKMRVKSAFFNFFNSQYILSF